MSLIQPGKAALFLLSDSSVARQAARTVEDLGYRAILAHDRDEALGLLNHEPVAILVCDLKEKTEDFAFFDAVTQSRASPRIVAILAQALDHYISELTERNFPLNLIADNHPLDYQELAVTIQKLMGGVFFGMAAYGVPTHESISFQSNAPKYELIGRVSDFFHQNQVPRRIVNNTELILNEMFMNAVFDAPVDEQGRSKFYHLKRSTRIDAEHRSYELSYGINEKWIGVSVTDLYGTFEPGTFFSHFRRRIDKEPLRQDGPGSGMGLFLIFKSLDKLIVNVAPGEKTEIIALIDRHTSAGELKKRRHSFHHFIRNQAHLVL